VRKGTPGSVRGAAEGEAAAGVRGWHRAKDLPVAGTPWPRRSGRLGPATRRFGS